MKAPKTLQDAIIYFADVDNCIRYIVDHRWPNGVVCPTCGRADVTWLPTQRKWQCKSAHAKRQFSAKVGTIFEDSPLGLEKWLPAVWMIASAKNGISSMEIHRALGVTQKTAWFMLHRIRKAMADGSLVKLGGRSGEIEADETYIGGKSRNMHKGKRLRAITNAANRGKTLVMGILERDGKIRTTVLPNLSRPLIHAEVRKHVEAGSALYTDSMHSYIGLDADYLHQIVDHAVKYVDGRIHTNGLENFWSLLKRGLHGTYVSVEPFHLFRYLDEQVFRYNNRATKDNPLTDADRFAYLLSHVTGKRLTYSELTGKVNATWA
jgi:transposase-like protein